VGDAHHDRARDLEPEEHPEQGNAPDERLRAVDGIDDPAVVRVAARLAQLLAEDRVAWEAGLDETAEELLRLAVGDGDEGLVLLPLDRDLALEVTEGEAPGLPGGVGGEIEERPLSGDGPLPASCGCLVSHPVAHAGMIRPMRASRRWITPAVALALAGLSAGAQERRVASPADLAERVQVVAEPGFQWRYAQEEGATYHDPTESLLSSRRAFVPGEKVRISFALDSPGPESPLQTRASFLLADLQGARIQDIGSADVRAVSDKVDGAIDWRVPDVGEGSYFLAARFADAEGRPLRTRSEIVFVAPEYPRLLAAAQAAVTQAEGARNSLAPLVRDVSLPSVEMLVEDAQAFFHDFGRAPRDWISVKQRLETARRFAETITAGRDPYRALTGFMVKAYRSEIDDTLQPYGLYVPRGYDPSGSYPLVVSLHGATSNHLLNMRRVFGLGNRPGESDYDAIRNEASLPDVDFLVATPYGRGETNSYTGIGENDVLRVMADVQKAYSVDPDRIHLTGLSMGGGGTWHLGLRYPDRFASITPVCAVASGDRPGRQPGAEDKAVSDLTSAYPVAENASNLQVFIFHGDQDPSVPVEQSRTMAKLFEGFGWLGKSARYFELPGVHHFAWDLAYRDASLFERVRDVRRTRVPKRVVYTTYSPRFNKAYWLRIDRIDKGLETARIEGERADGRISLTTRNLSAFSVLLDAEVAPSGRAIDVWADGKRIFRGQPRGTTLSFSRSANGFVERPWFGPAQGPPDHADMGLGLNGHEEVRSLPVLAQFGGHVYVYGTGGGAEMAEAAKRGAEALADWRPRSKALWKVVADADVTSQMITTEDLVLVGNARTNSVVARLAPNLPLRDEAGGVFAGGKRVAAPDAAYRLACATPGAPGRHVLVYGAGSPSALDRLLPPRKGLFVLPLTADYLVLDPDGSMKLAGLFRNAWKVGE
jgi:pimeloyl-ACP methyl ester carboxylesterase